MIRLFEPSEDLKNCRLILDKLRISKREYLIGCDISHVDFLNFSEAVNRLESFIDSLHVCLEDDYSPDNWGEIELQTVYDGKIFHISDVTSLQGRILDALHLSE